MNKKTLDYVNAVRALREAETVGEYSKRPRLAHRLKSRVKRAKRALSAEERAELGLDDEGVQS